MLFYIGVWDTGVGYVLDYEWPAWPITIIDGVAAFLLWSGYRKGSSSPWLGLVQTSVASALMLTRALWIVLVPVSVALTIAGSIGRILAPKRPVDMRE